ncbi:MAG: hypothetical protein H6895_10950 [Defluviimonas sp.]|uniref:hypothetical protein n=1 Tax=Albidovulum sp. TaxID=1872424 RepID=UPI002A2722D8|nr:hypothetical protein [Defluviimonas sp.]
MTNLIEKARLGRTNALSALYGPGAHRSIAHGDRVSVRHVPAIFVSARAQETVVNIYA